MSLSSIVAEDNAQVRQHRNLICDGKRQHRVEPRAIALAAGQPVFRTTASGVAIQPVRPS
jgi:hypothetical protein